MIPINKQDHDAILQLSEASDAVVIEHIQELLTWLEDANWPVFPGVVDRLASLGEEIVEEVHDVLRCNDSIHRCNIIGHLIPRFSNEAQKLYTDELERILKEFTVEDLEEGVIDYVEMQLANVRKLT